MQEEWFVAIKIIYMESSININTHEIVFVGKSRKFKHNHNEPYRHWHKDGGWHTLSIVTSPCGQGPWKV